jgi:hypothetical protein
VPRRPSPPLEDTSAYLGVTVGSRWRNRRSGKVHVVTRLSYYRSDWSQSARTPKVHLDGGSDSCHPRWLTSHYTRVPDA